MQAGYSRERGAFSKVPQRSAYDELFAFLTIENALIGGATEARGISDPTIRVRLNGGMPRRSAIHFRDLTFARIILPKRAGSSGQPEAENTPAGFLRLAEQY